MNWSPEEARQRLERAQAVRLLQRAESNRKYYQQWANEDAPRDLRAALTRLAQAEQALRTVLDTPTLPHWCAACGAESYCYGPEIPAWDVAHAYFLGRGQ